MQTMPGRGTENADPDGVSCCALLAEPDRALRALMHRTLSEAGFQVVETSNLAQLESSLASASVFAAPNALFVLPAWLVSRSVASISAAGAERSRRGLAPARLILTREFGSSALPVGEPTPCGADGVLEKPFELEDLFVLALACRRLEPPFATHGGPA